MCVRVSVRSSNLFEKGAKSHILWLNHFGSPPSVPNWGCPWGRGLPSSTWVWGEAQAQSREPAVTWYSRCFTVVCLEMPSLPGAHHPSVLSQPDWELYQKMTRSYYFSFFFFTEVKKRQIQQKFIKNVKPPLTQPALIIRVWSKRRSQRKLTPALNYWGTWIAFDLNDRKYELPSDPLSPFITLSSSPSQLLSIWMLPLTWYASPELCFFHVFNISLQWFPILSIYLGKILEEYMKIYFFDTWVLSLHSSTFALPLTHISYNSVYKSGSTLAVQTSLHHNSTELNFQLHGIIWGLHVIVLCISRMQYKIKISSTVHLYQTCLGWPLLLLYAHGAKHNLRMVDLTWMTTVKLHFLWTPWKLRLYAEQWTKQCQLLRCNWEPFVRLVSWVKTKL